MSVSLDSITFRNFLSYPNKPTRFNFKEGITRISGINGQGKSAVVDATYYALFGKPYRKINLPKLINSINRKDLWVELKFQIKENKFRIERGIKPNIFKIFKNDVLIDIDSSYKDYQEYLEEDILHFSEDIFQQIGIKSLTRYDSFLTLPKGKKRQIIESIFGLSILTGMKELNKDDIDNLETDIYNFKKELGKYEMLKDQELRNIEQLKQLKNQIDEKSKKEKRDKSDKIEELEKEIIALNKGIKIIERNKKILEDIQTKLKYNEVAFGEVEKELKPLENKLKKYLEHCMFMEERCSGCPELQGIINDKDNQKLKDKEIQLNEYWDELLIEKRELEESHRKTSLLTINEKIIRHKIQTKRKDVSIIKRELDSSSSNNIKIDETNLKKYINKIKQINDGTVQIYSELEYLNTIHQLLDDSGIKSHIIKRYLPLLNKLMNTFLIKFGIDLEMSFNPDLEIEILTKFKENYAYESFSEGEKRRINLALTFTFLEFCKLKYSTSSLNVLFLDEFSTGLDAEGENVLYEVLQTMVEKEQKDIITISHSMMIDPEKVTRLFVAEKTRGYSSLVLSDKL